MNELNRALGDISSIRRQVAQGTEFRGYGPATLAASGLVAAFAAAVQGARVPDPSNHIRAYLVLWLATAMVCATLAGVQMYTRTRRIHSAMDANGSYSRSSSRSSCFRLAACSRSGRASRS